MFYSSLHVRSILKHIWTKQYQSFPSVSEFPLFAKLSSFPFSLLGEVFLARSSFIGTDISRVFLFPSFLRGSVRKGTNNRDTIGHSIRNKTNVHTIERNWIKCRLETEINCLPREPGFPQSSPGNKKKEPIYPNVISQNSIVYSCPVCCSAFAANKTGQKITRAWGGTGKTCFALFVLFSSSFPFFLPPSSSV